MVRNRLSYLTTLDDWHLPLIVGVLLDDFEAGVDMARR